MNAHNVTYDLNTYGLKYSALSQRSFKDLLIIFGYFWFLSLSSFFITCLQFLMHKETSTVIYILYIVYFRFFLLKVPEIFIGRCFWKDGYYSQQIISVVAKETLIIYNLTQRVPETQSS